MHHLQVNAKDIDRQLSGSEMADLTAFSSLIQNDLEPATLYTTWCETESFSKHAQVFQVVEAPTHADASTTTRFQILTEIGISVWQD